jgi:ribosomal protein S18 acetylase RimI-like enzyme
VQGRGLGHKLMEQALVLAREAGCQSCHLDVDSSTPAVRFHERLGFRVLVRTEVPGLPTIPPHLRLVRDL